MTSMMMTIWIEYPPHRNATRLMQFHLDKRPRRTMARMPRVDLEDVDDDS
jgi:hypothetical protein